MAPLYTRWQILVLVHLPKLLLLGVVESGAEAELQTESVSEVEIDASTGNIKDTATPANNGAVDNHTVSSLPSFVEECGIWLAPSAIEGAGLGMYAGKSFNEGDVFQVMGDIIVPIIDLYMHNQKSDFFFLWDEYHWNGPSVGIDHEGYHKSEGCSSGFGSTANSFIPVYNVEEGMPKRSIGEGLHRFKDPGVGAFTEYYDREITATRFIEAGEELYVNYGAHWFEGRTDKLGPIPLKGDLEKATLLFLAFEKLKQSTEAPTEKMDELWDVFVRNNVFKDSRVFGSFRHHDKEEIELLKEFRSMRKLRVAQASKTREWLYEHGTCGDHIYGGNSTLKQAGRGAFASWDLPEGLVVAQLPLIHITDRDLLNMYYFDENLEEGATKVGSRPPQLLLNYCFGHSESSILLCSYGPNVNYINHNKTRANVKIQWADPKRGNFMPHLLKEPLDALEADSTAKLAFELVATRPISKNEEIFLDYGDDWEQAWQAHIESWEPVEGAEDYVSTAEFYESVDESNRLRSVDDLVNDPYPSNIELRCNDFFWEGEIGWRDVDEGEREAYMENFEWFPCRILEKTYDEEEDMYLFTAEPTSDDFTNADMEDLPDWAFFLQEKPYTTDMFLDNAFRHDIRIPDAIFPDAWRNKK